MWYGFYFSVLIEIPFFPSKKCNYFYPLKGNLIFFSEFTFVCLQHLMSLFKHRIWGAHSFPGWRNTEELITVCFSPFFFLFFLLKNCIRNLGTEFINLILTYLFKRYFKIQKVSHQWMTSAWLDHAEMLLSYKLVCISPFLRCSYKKKHRK